MSMKTAVGLLAFFCNKCVCSERSTEGGQKAGGTGQAAGANGLQARWNGQGD